MLNPKTILLISSGKCLLFLFITFYGLGNAKTTLTNPIATDNDGRVMITRN